MNPAFSNIIHVSKPGAFHTVLFIAVNQLGGLKKLVLTDACKHQVRYPRDDTTVSL